MKNTCDTTFSVLKRKHCLGFTLQFNILYHILSVVSRTSTQVIRYCFRIRAHTKGEKSVLQYAKSTHSVVQFQLMMWSVVGRRCARFILRTSRESEPIYEWQTKAGSTSWVERFGGTNAYVVRLIGGHMYVTAFSPDATAIIREVESILPNHFAAHRLTRQPNWKRNSSSHQRPFQQHQISIIYKHITCTVRIYGSLRHTSTSWAYEISDSMDSH